MPARPTVSVIVPFHGSDADLHALLARLACLRRRPGDELIVADNRPAAPRAESRAAGIRILPASGAQAPGFARNRAAAVADGEWLVFIDADTSPRPDLLDAYLVPSPAPDVAILAGTVRDVMGTRATWTARHSVARGQMSQEVTLLRPRPYAQSANLAVRRSAFAAGGGFSERARAGEDADLCLRLVAAGHRLERRPAAAVDHVARSRLRDVVAQLAQHGAGARWCEQRHPGAFPGPSPSELLRRILHSVRVAQAAARRGDRDATAFALLEIPETLAFELGRLLSNEPRRRTRRPGPSRA